LREHWRELDYWRWLWHRRVPPEAKVALSALVLLVLLGGGWIAADRLTSAHAVSSSSDFVLETTVQKVVTVRERGKVVRRIVPVVKRVYLKRQTAYEVQTKYEKQFVTAPGTVRVLRRIVTTYVPTVKRELVKVNGKTRTVVRTQLVPTTKVQTQTLTQTRVLTNQQTVTNQQTITNTERGRPVTHTETQTQTQTKTQTLPPATVTQTKTETQTVTETKTETETETHTVTETETVTVTVTEPGGTTTVTVTTVP
jgi:hypothetical protein